jgi:8-oxo-dGTP diphosphatase
MKSLQVACAIIEHDGKVLAAQRSETMSLPLKWEFPGGKILEQESPEACLVREVMEELGLYVTVGRALPQVSHAYADFSVTLYPFICTIVAGTLTLHEHKAVRWLQPAGLPSLDWAAADLPIITTYLEPKRKK